MQNYWEQSRNQKILNVNSSFLVSDFFINGEHRTRGDIYAVADQKTPKTF